MNLVSQSLSPPTYLNPIGVVRDDHGGVLSADIEDEAVDGGKAMVNDPIIGMDRVVFDDKTGPGALDALPLPSPKGMTPAKRAIHDITHLPYDPSCEVCVSCRRPNTHHTSMSKSAERSVPLLVGESCFAKHSADVDPLTILVIRIYPYKLFMCCVVSSKGRDPLVVDRLVRFIKDCGLTQFTYRSDREPAIMAMMDEACALSGRNGRKDSNVSESAAISHAELVNGESLVIDPDISDEPHADVTQASSSTHTAAPEFTHPGESQSNGLAE